MLMQLAFGFLAGAPDPPSPFLAPAIEWCSRPSDWAATEVVTGAYVWTIDVQLDYVPATRTLRIFANLLNGWSGTMVSLYLPLPYPCVSVDPNPSFPIVNWLDPALGWLHASIVKPPGIPWPEAMEAGAVVLLVQ